MEGRENDDKKAGQSKNKTDSTEKKFDKQRADALIADAEKKLNPGIFGKLFASPTRLDDAASDLNKAANLYRIGNQWDQAGKLFERAAKVFLEAKSSHDAATSYINASNCYKKLQHKILLVVSISLLLFSLKMVNSH